MDLKSVSENRSSFELCQSLLNARLKIQLRPLSAGFIALPPAFRRSPHCSPVCPPHYNTSRRTQVNPVDLTRLWWTLNGRRQCSRMANSTRLPLLVAFDLDYTKWDLWVDVSTSHSFQAIQNLAVLIIFLFSSAGRLTSLHHSSDAVRSSTRSTTSTASHFRSTRTYLPSYSSWTLRKCTLLLLLELLLPKRQYSLRRVCEEDADLLSLL